MGTLFEQPRRQFLDVSTDNIDDFLSVANHLAKKHKLSVADVIAARAVLETARASDLAVRNGDVFDEQMAGLGRLLEELTSAIESLKVAG
ncbi:hypothetical protein [Ralstonia pseudosolanacearum]|uniref:Uncharacterized protein n=1 Tax=Ralstonia nicotianae (strain ATCC BAA-1114 / GMI1000) TaxID=267608 RepID=Q8XY17_RALN1|nr:hypothetical protein [Ralstonia pseudosolanacearum]AST27506.1 hypothetical protein CDC45_09980 [Ralstonia pseudosolanacearum]MCQ4681243.1 hypothetical protein [Ralstonia pseudosolanacearum]MDC6282486.1 hypothetical protein [Ralstonia pseudosolanacearum]CAD15648.1 hypothetical protein RSc1946 [Ralstonia pseudosolanacearum GMI1000]